MREFFKKRISPATFRYGIIALVFGIAAPFILSPILYQRCLQAEKKALATATREIQNLLYVYLAEIQNTITHVGHEIVQSGADNLQGIIEHLTAAQQGHRYYNALYSYTLLDWVTTDSYMIANSRQGVLSPPVQVTHRNYIVECPLSPWKVILCAPAWGLTSGTWIIPFGMGITSPEGRFLGTITGGVNIQSLERKIQQHLQDPFTNFMICDKDLHVVCHSLDDQDQDFSSLPRALFGAFDCKLQEQGLLEKPIRIKSADFYSYQKADDFPLYIFTGLTPKAMDREFRSLFFFHFVEILSATLGFLCLLYFFSRRISRETLATSQENQVLRKVNGELARESGVFKGAIEAEEAFLQKVRQESLLSLEEVEGLTTVLLKNARGDLNFPLSAEQQIDLLESIDEQIEHLRAETAGSLNLSEVHLGKVIEESMKIHSNLAFAKNISLSSTIAQETHVLQGDEVRLAQVVASLLYKAIECTPHGGTVHIELSLAMKEARPHVQMAIRHNGFGLTEEDLSRLSGQFKKGEFRYLGPLALEFAAIQKLVHLHGGTLETQSKWAEWTAFIVTMPQGAISRLESLQS